MQEVNQEVEVSQDSPVTESTEETVIVETVIVETEGTESDETSA